MRRSHFRRTRMPIFEGGRVAIPPVLRGGPSGHLVTTRGHSAIVGHACATCARFATRTYFAGNWAFPPLFGDRFDESGLKSPLTFLARYLSNAFRWRAILF